jgi:hypothetical protein
MPRNAILLRGDAEQLSGIVTTATITPGMLVEHTSTNGFRRHATAGGAAGAFFAREQHENNGAGIDDAIAVGDEVTVLACEKGSMVNAYTTDTIARGNFVESDGVGGVRVFAAGVKLGVANSASDLSGDVGRVEIIIL